MGFVELLKRRVRDDDGGIMVFIIMMFLTMIVAAGMAVDFMRHETARADLQNALDRGVLAVTASSQKAADLASQEEIENLVASYMNSRSFSNAEMDLSVPLPVLSGTSSREFNATATYELNTYFLKLIGIPTMLVRADSKAIEGFYDLELVLVLDVSSSMHWQFSDGKSAGDRLENLKVGAKAFVTRLLEGDRADKTLISIVPFSGNTSLPSWMASYYNITTDDYFDYASIDYDNLPSGVGTDARDSVCLEYDFGNLNSDGGSYNGELGDFSENIIEPVGFGGGSGTEFTRAKHYRIVEHDIYDPFDAAGCPGQENTIFPYSNNETALHNHIEGLTAEFSTATYIGIKWGAALLDTSSTDVLTGMYNDGNLSLDSHFADGYWPRDKSPGSEFSDTRKVIVVFSDGANTEHSILNEHADGNNFVVNGAERTYYEGDPRTNADDGDARALYVYWDTMDTTDIDDGGYEDFNQYHPNWASKHHNGFRKDIIHRDNIDNQSGGSDKSHGDMVMDEICSLAKAQGAEIYTIAYELAEESTDALEDCSSDLDNKTFYSGVTGENLTTTFEEIAAGVTKLRLAY